MRHFTAAALLVVETMDIREKVLSLHLLAVGWKFFLSLRSALLQHSMVQVSSDLHGKCRLVRLAAMSHSYVQQGSPVKRWLLLRVEYRLLCELVFAAKRARAGVFATE